MTEKDKVLIALSTCPSMETAESIAKTLVEEQLAACVNCLPGMLSTYRWEGRVESANETLLIIKMTEQGFAALQTRLKELHPYELPELIAIPVCAGAENYLEWVRDSVK